MRDIQNKFNTMFNLYFFSSDCWIEYGIFSVCEIRKTPRFVLDFMEWNSYRKKQRSSSLAQMYGIIDGDIAI